MARVTDGRRPTWICPHPTREPGPMSGASVPDTFGGRRNALLRALRPGLVSGFWALRPPAGRAAGEQTFQQIQQQLQQRPDLAQQAHPYMALVLHRTLAGAVRHAVEQSVQQALPTAIVALLRQSQGQGQQGQQQWGGGFGQQSFGQQYPQYQQPGFGFGQMGQPFGMS
jgi:hypothetical protein